MSNCHVLPLNRISHKFVRLPMSPCNNNTHLKISALTMSRIQEISYFELVKAKSQHPVARCSTKAAEPVPTGQRLTAVLVRYLRRGYVYINVHCFVAVILKGVAHIST